MDAMGRLLPLSCGMTAVEAVFWKFFTPYNQFGEPLILVSLELVFWACIAYAEAAAIAWIIEKETVAG